MFKIAIFIIVSIGILILFLKYLRQRHSHDFCVFFAFQSILWLLFLNMDYWFRNTFSAMQIVSWLLLLCSLILVIQGFYLLHKIGRPEHGIETTTVLVKRGIYKYIRHPLYSSLMSLSWGIFFKDFSLFSIALVLIATIFLIATAMVEEKENIQKFGAEYTAYMKETKRFIPFLI